jgi:2-dehydropantoate 2-reductase
MPGKESVVQPIHVVGAGGIGCALGYALRSAGIETVFVDANHEKVRWGNARGVGIQGRVNQPAQFVSFEQWQPGTDATILLCTKCYDNARVLSRVPKSARLIPIQNGFDPGLDSWSHPVEGVASFVSECDPDRPVTRITRRGQLHFGCRRAKEYTGRPEPLDCLSGCDLFEVRFVTNVLPYKYTKLMYNAAISPLAAAAGLDNGELLAVPQARRLFFALLRENYNILRGADIELGVIGPFHPRTVARILRRRLVSRLLAWVFYPTLRGSYCSMSGDLPTGITEIDFYNGYLIRLAGERPCPLNRRVYELVKRMERERIPPAVHMLDVL